MCVITEAFLTVAQAQQKALDYPALPFVMLEHPVAIATDAEVEHKVELMEGNATEVVAGLRGPFDCVFFDADRVSAPSQLRLLLPKLRDDVLLLADNALSHPEEISAYKTLVEQLPGFICTLTPVGKGLHIAWRRGA